MLPGKDMPMFPLNLVGDFGGGGLMSVVGILLALVERGKTGRGQVVTTDIVGIFLALFWITLTSSTGLWNAVSIFLSPYFSTSPSTHL